MNLQIDLFVILLENNCGCNYIGLLYQKSPFMQIICRKQCDCNLR